MRAILVHGGAGRHRRATLPEKRLALRRAADAGWAVLADGGGAVAAVEAATRLLEAMPLFDAGAGSYPNLDGMVEVDAVIMDGASLHFGAVAAVQYVLHPVTLARLVMTDTPHGFLVGPGAERLARDRGLTVPLSELLSEEALRVWREARGLPPGTAADRPAGSTVGAVAVDEAGHLAAATSTGGTCNKWPGRVGDTPVVGAGAYADDDAAAVSCTGEGEQILRLCLAYRVAAAVRAGASPATAAEQAVALLAERTGAEGGLVVAGPDGRLGWAWNTDAMPYAWQDETGQGEGH